MPQLDGTHDGPPTTITDSVNPSGDGEDQVPAKSDEADTVAKPAEVPDSDTANPSNRNGDESTVSAVVPHVNELEEDGDHIVEGDEDTVVY